MASIRPAATAFVCPARERMRARMRGFTLMELMVAVAIMGILAAIAIPSYAEYVRRSKIIDATTGLSDFRVRMEQFFLDNRSYQSAGKCGVPDPASTAFEIKCTSADARSYTVTATGLASKAMAGFVYTIDQANLRKTTGAPVGWATSDTCWVTRKDGTCG